MTSTVAGRIRLVGYQGRAADGATVVGEIEGVRPSGEGDRQDRLREAREDGHFDDNPGLSSYPAWPEWCGTK